MSRATERAALAACESYLRDRRYALGDLESTPVREEHNRVSELLRAVRQALPKRCAACLRSVRTYSAIGMEDEADIMCRACESRA